MSAFAPWWVGFIFVGVPLIARSPGLVVVFDVDGTLIGGDEADWECFDSAFAEVSGFRLGEASVHDLPEVTAKSIVHSALAHLPLGERDAREVAVRDIYVRNLRAEIARHPEAFGARPGVKELLEDLHRRGVPAAIATGDWRESILPKLESSALEITHLPLVTSSEFYSRAEAITAGVARAGGTLENAVYVGDGLWDLRACRKLGIPLLGVGTGTNKLAAAGAEYILPDIEVSSFWVMMDKITASRGTFR